MKKNFIGIDVGTQGARVVLLDLCGEIVSEKEQEFILNGQSREEQSPIVWWQTCLKILEELVKDAQRKIDLNNIKAIAVTSTSGTVIPLDQNNQPLHNALMYSDKRSAEVALECEKAAIQYFKGKPAYTHFNASSGLSKMVWFIKQFPEKVPQINKWVHAADFIMGQLCGHFNISDETNALKSGYDIFSRSWPDYIYKELPLKKEWLPEVLSSGIPVGLLTPSLAHKLNLSPNIQVVAGMTDGCASQVASGAVNPGEWNTTIGTTLVVKGVTKEAIIDAQGRIYNHRHPDGYAMPGGASNTGADWIKENFSSNLKQLNQEALKLIPTDFISWPLRQQGERFPFIAPQARGFQPQGLSRVEQYASNMEGVAFIERYAYDLIEHLSGEKVNAVFTAGGGSHSDTWLKIRSNVLNLPIYKMKYTGASAGTAILASSRTHFHSLAEAARAMTQSEKIIQPEPHLVECYDKNYKRFIAILIQKGYVNN